MIGKTDDGKHARRSLNKERGGQIREARTGEGSGAGRCCRLVEIQLWRSGVAVDEEGTAQTPKHLGHTQKQLRLLPRPLCLNHACRHNRFGVFKFIHKTQRSHSDRDHRNVGYDCRCFNPYQFIFSF